MIYIKRKSAVAPISGSIVDTFEIDNRTTNTYSARVIDELVGSGGGTDISTIIDLIYPVGRGFIDFTDTDYSNWLGLTWERELVGMMPIGKNANDTDFNTVGKKGGAKTHSHTQSNTTGSTTLTAAQSGLPSHSHIIKYDGTYPIYGNKAAKTDFSNDERSVTIHINDTTSTSHLSAITTTAQNASSGHTHTLSSTNSSNNLPPYQVVSYWKRVDPNAVKTISFSVTGEYSGGPYQAEEGMTFAQWVDSEYNVDGWYLSGTEVRPDYNHYVSGNISTDIITNNMVVRVVKGK